jgi:hypothetical protein
MMQIMQRFELSMNDMIKLLTREPLSPYSTTIYTISQSPNNHHETGKR